jgi:hypothetical protein
VQRASLECLADVFREASLMSPVQAGEMFVAVATHAITAHSSITIPPRRRDMCVVLLLQLLLLLLLLLLVVLLLRLLF